ncbi:MAG TPA: succinate dehydrogenase, cytochrome b556 subunit [Rhodocyclaceae bacterium]|nr:succinate dehydrogenase, cytochrome b556 subunit [Rhodocyclaceae bacterium]
MTEAVIRKPRPKHLNLMQIRLPLPGIVSILHRISGVGLFLCLPLLLWLFGSSLGSRDELDAFYAVFDCTVLGLPVVKLVLLGLLWSYLHHFCAGIRFLLLDMHVGIELPAARLSSYIVLAVSLTLTVVIGALIW